MDILTGCTGSIAAEVVRYTAEPVIRHVGYLFRFKKIVVDLKKAKTHLQLEQQNVQGAIRRAAMNNEIPENDVERWLENVKELMVKVQALENQVQVNLRFCNGWCPDWIRQYKLCKEAIQKTNDVKELQDKGKFSKLTHRAPTPGIEIFSSSDFVMFKSRNLDFQQIMEALRDDNIKRIGLHGMGGVGKTTLVKEAYKKAKELNIFNDIVITVVSSTPNVRRIQGEIAGCLNLKLEEESDMVRANQICSRIKSVEKILIILDDVWKDVNLEDYGIPSCDDHRGCKILLTTRNVHVCNVMHCQRKIPLNLLAEEESLTLMRKTAGIVDDDPDWNDAVQNVVKKCKGLPLAIITIGKALRGKSLNHWNAAMQDLRNYRLEDIEGVEEEENIYVCLKWSYDQLKCRTKLCFLLCSLFPEDYEIPIEELTRYAMVLEEYQDFPKLEDRRSQVLIAIDRLKDSSLLLEGSEKEFVKMHDVVRDIGLWITSKGVNEFELRACTRLERSTDFERVTAISLTNYDTKQCPDKLVCPRLNIFLLDGIYEEISNALFEGMKCLKVLKLSSIMLSSQSLELLTNLQTLYLEECNFSDDLSSLGKLKSLETLSFHSCEMDALPIELGEMASLKMLDLTDCHQLLRIPQNVIRRLSKLEELFINGCERFKNWDVEGTTNANLSELNSLGCLVVLSLKLKSKHLPKGFVFPANLQRYFISINCFWTPLTSNDYFGLRCSNSRTIEIKDLNASSMNALKSLFRTVECIWIRSCEMECIVDTNGGNHTVTFGNLVELYLEEISSLRTIYKIFSNLTKLKTLEVRNCENLECIFPIPIAQGPPLLERLVLQNIPRLKKVFGQEREGEVRDCEIESHYQPTGFPKLKILWVRNCGILEYIFPISIAQDLPQLEILELKDLPRLKQVFGHERGGDVIVGDGNNNLLSELRRLILENLGELDSLGGGNSSSVWPLLERLYVANCPKVKLFADVEANARALIKLQNLQILKVDNRNTNPSYMMQGLSNLKVLKIKNCGGIQEMIIWKSPIQLVRGEQEDVLFPRLRKLYLVDLHESTYIWKSPIQLVNFNNLEVLEVIGCKKLTHLFTSDLARSLQKLKYLEIERCDELEHLIVENVEEQVSLESHLQSYASLNWKESLSNIAIN